ncbi:MAG: hypothetical protein R3335_12105 [Anaerolineales bacterium]|nr:hypothetical protein [Anaerolineales bacterium]
MKPVVNGLEKIFEDRITFLSVDANSREGRDALQAYQLQGHPAFAVIGPNGEILWTGLGEQAGAVLQERLNIILDNP